MIGGKRGRPQEAAQADPAARRERRRTILLGTAATAVAVLSVTQNRTQMQVSVRVVDSCTAGTGSTGIPAQGACAAQPAISGPIPASAAGSTDTGQSRATAQQDKTSDGYTSFIF